MAQWCGACERLSGRLGVCVESKEQKGLLLLSSLSPSLLFVINELILLMTLFLLCVFACTNVESMGGHQIS